MLEVGKEYIDVETYLLKEETAEIKNEYHNGEIFAMTGATHSHNLITVNISAALHSALHEKECFVYSGDMKIQVDPEKHYTYPDVSVICGDVAFAKGRRDTVANPIAIFEVLSEATRDYDRGSKFKAYRKISSLRDYVLIDQYSCSVEYFYKNESGQWSLLEFDQIHETCNIRSLDVNLPMATIYFKLDLP